jgi:hypothetical protein
MFQANSLRIDDFGSIGDLWTYLWLYHVSIWKLMMLIDSNMEFLIALH